MESHGRRPNSKAAWCHCLATRPFLCLEQNASGGREEPESKNLIGHVVAFGLEPEVHGE